jgi:hypothetical protein
MLSCRGSNSAVELAVDLAQAPVQHQHMLATEHSASQLFLASRTDTQQHLLAAWESQLLLYCKGRNPNNLHIQRNTDSVIRFWEQFLTVVAEWSYGSPVR